MSVSGMHSGEKGEAAGKLLEPGDMFGDYTVEKLLGKGGKVARVVFTLYHACNVKIYLNGDLVLDKADRNDWWEKIEIPAEAFAQRSERATTCWRSRRRTISECVISTAA